MKVVFSNRAYASVLAETTEKIKTETGGLFLGTVLDDTWYVIEAIDPGPKSIFEVAYFEYDQKYTQHLINKVANLYAKQLSLIGLWHRHPGSFDQFSSTDNGTNAKYAAMRKEGAISALVNVDPSFRITMYQVDRPCRYQKISYEVGNHLIPNELLELKTSDTFFDIMNNLLDPYRRTSKGDYHESVSLCSFMQFVIPMLEGYKLNCIDKNAWLNDDSQEKLVDGLINDLTFMTDTLHIETAMLLDSECIKVYQEEIDKMTELHFMYSSSNNSIILLYDDVYYSYHKGLLTEAFGNAKANKTSASNTNIETSVIKHENILSSVVKIIGFNTNKD